MGEQRRAMTDILLRNILGAAFDGMPEAVRRMHSIERTQDVRGISRIMGGKNLLSWLIRVVAALPTPAHHAPISIRFIKAPNDAKWSRHFWKCRFHTIMKPYRI